MTLQEFKSTDWYNGGTFVIYNGHKFRVGEASYEERLLALWFEMEQYAEWVRYENCILVPENPADLDKVKKDSKKLLTDFMAS